MQRFEACLLAVLMITLGGCGGDDGSATDVEQSGESAAKLPAPPRPNPIDAAAAAKIAAAGQVPAGAVRPGGTVPPAAAGGPGASALPEEMLRSLFPGRGGIANSRAANPATAGAVDSDVPEDVTKWTDDQIETAVRGGDARAVQAIDARVEQSSDDEALAELLRKLLDATVPADDGDLNNQSFRPSTLQPFLVAQLRDHLTSSAAFRLADKKDREDKQSNPVLPPGIQIPGITLPPGQKLPPGLKLPEGIRIEEFPRRGRGFPTPGRRPRAPGQNVDDRELFAAIVRGLVRSRSDSAWTTLVNIMTGEQKTALLPEESAMVVFEEVFGSEASRADAAEQFAIRVVMAESTPKPAMELLTSLSHRMARSDLHLPDEKSDEEQPRPNAFAGFGAGFGAGIGAGRRPIPGNIGAAGEKPPLPKVKLPESSADNLNALRAAGFIDAVQKKVEAGSGFTPEDASLLGLASTLPSVNIRKATFARFSAAHADGATLLLDEGVYRDYSRDPGHLAVLKALPQLRPERGSTANADPNGPEISWVKATWMVVQAMRDQLKESANDRNLAWDGRQPIRLHRGAEPEISIRLVIPDGSESDSGTTDSGTADSGKKAAEADDSAADEDNPANDESGDDNTGQEQADDAPSGTVVYYTRCLITPERPSDRKKISEHYEARTRGVRRELADQGIVWFDGGRRNQDGTRVTMDVLIEQVRDQANPGAGFGALAAGRGAGGVSYSIEAITVIVQDPSAAAN